MKKYFLKTILGIVTITFVILSLFAITNIIVENRDEVDDLISTTEEETSKVKREAMTNATSSQLSSLGVSSFSYTVNTSSATTQYYNGSSWRTLTPNSNNTISVHANSSSGVSHSFYFVRTSMSLNSTTMSSWTLINNAYGYGTSIGPMNGYNQSTFNYAGAWCIAGVNVDFSAAVFRIDDQGYVCVYPACATNIVPYYLTSTGALQTAKPSTPTIPTYQITATSSNTNYGTVSNSATGYLKPGATATITATPKAGYEFSYWQKTGTSTKVTSNPYTVTVGSANETWTAYFTAAKVSISATASIVDSLNYAFSGLGGGTVIGGGSYTYGSRVTLTAVPAAGYKFVHYRTGTALNSTVLSTNSSYSFTAGATNQTIYACFALVVYDFEVREIGSTNNDDPDRIKTIVNTWPLTGVGKTGHTVIGYTITGYGSNAEYTVNGSTWNKITNQTIPYNATSIRNLADADGDEVILIIRYSINSYKQTVVNLTPNYGTAYVRYNNSNYSSYNVPYSSTYSLVATPATGYKFDGWYTNAGCTGTPISTSASYPIECGTTINTYYPKFSQKDIHISSTYTNNDSILQYNNLRDALNYAINNNIYNIYIDSPVGSLFQNYNTFINQPGNYILYNTSKEINIIGIGSNNTIYNNGANCLIDVRSGTLNFENVTFYGTGVSKTSGNRDNALIRVSGGELNITNSTITNNYNIGSGIHFVGDWCPGAIDLYQGTLNLTNTKLENNTTTYGGDIFIHGGTLNMTGGSITSSNASGIYAIGSSKVNLNNAAAASIYLDANATLSIQNIKTTLSVYKQGKMEIGNTVGTTDTSSAGYVEGVSTTSELKGSASGTSLVWTTKPIATKSKLQLAIEKASNDKQFTINLGESISLAEALGKYVYHLNGCLYIGSVEVPAGAATVSGSGKRAIITGNQIGEIEITLKNIRTRGCYYYGTTSINELTITMKVLPRVGSIASGNNTIAVTNCTENATYTLKDAAGNTVATAQSQLDQKTQEYYVLFDSTSPLTQYTIEVTKDGLQNSQTITTPNKHALQIAIENASGFYMNVNQTESLSSILGRSVYHLRWCIAVDNVRVTSNQDNIRLNGNNKNATITALKPGYVDLTLNVKTNGWCAVYGTVANYLENINVRIYILPSVSDSEVTITTSSITLPTKTGYEYSLDGINYSSSATFNSLSQNTNYTVYVRYTFTEEGNETSLVGTYAFTTLLDKSSVSNASTGVQNKIESIREQLKDLNLSDKTYDDLNTILDNYQAKVNQGLDITTLEAINQALDNLNQVATSSSSLDVNDSIANQTTAEVENYLDEIVKSSNDNITDATQKINNNVGIVETVNDYKTIIDEIKTNIDATIEDYNKILEDYDNLTNEEKKALNEDIATIKDIYATKVNSEINATLNNLSEAEKASFIEKINAKDTANEVYVEYKKAIANDLINQTLAENKVALEVVEDKVNAIINLNTSSLTDADATINSNVTDVLDTIYQTSLDNFASTQEVNKLPSANYEKNKIETTSNGYEYNGTTYPTYKDAYDAAIISDQKKIANTKVSTLVANYKDYLNTSSLSQEVKNALITNIDQASANILDNTQSLEELEAAITKLETTIELEILKVNTISSITADADKKKAEFNSLDEVTKTSLQDKVDSVMNDYVSKVIAATTTNQVLSDDKAFDNKLVALDTEALYVKELVKEYNKYSLINPELKLDLDDLLSEGIQKILSASNISTALETLNEYKEKFALVSDKQNALDTVNPVYNECLSKVNGTYKNNINSLNTAFINSVLEAPLGTDYSNSINDTITKMNLEVSKYDAYKQMNAYANNIISSINSLSNISDSKKTEIIMSAQLCTLNAIRNLNKVTASSDIPSIKNTLISDLDEIKASAIATNDANTSAIENLITSIEVITNNEVKVLFDKVVTESIQNEIEKIKNGETGNREKIANAISSSEAYQEYLEKIENESTINNYQVDDYFEEALSGIIDGTLTIDDFKTSLDEMITLETLEKGKLIQIDNLPVLTDVQKDEYKEQVAQKIASAIEDIKASVDVDNAALENEVNQVTDAATSEALPELDKQKNTIKSEISEIQAIVSGIIATEDLPLIDNINNATTSESLNAAYQTYLSELTDKLLTKVNDLKVDDLSSETNEVKVDEYSAYLSTVTTDNVTANNCLDEYSKITNIISDYGKLNTSSNTKELTNTLTNETLKNHVNDLVQKGLMEIINDDSNITTTIADIRDYQALEEAYNSALDESYIKKLTDYAITSNIPLAQLNNENYQTLEVLVDKVKASIATSTDEISSILSEIDTTMNNWNSASISANMSNYGEVITKVASILALDEKTNLSSQVTNATSIDELNNVIEYITSLDTITEVSVEELKAKVEAVKNIITAATTDPSYQNFEYRNDTDDTIKYFNDIILDNITLDDAQKIINELANFSDITLKQEEYNQKVNNLSEVVSSLKTCDTSLDEISGNNFVDAIASYDKIINDGETLTYNEYNNLLTKVEEYISNDTGYQELKDIIQTIANEEVKTLVEVAINESISISSATQAVVNAIRTDQAISFLETAANNTYNTSVNVEDIITIYSNNETTTDYQDLLDSKVLETVKEIASTALKDISTNDYVVQDLETTTISSLETTDAVASKYQELKQLINHKLDKVAEVNTQTATAIENWNLDSTIINTSKDRLIDDLHSLTSTDDVDTKVTEYKDLVTKAIIEKVKESLDNTLSENYKDDLETLITPNTTLDDILNTPISENVYSVEKIKETVATTLSEVDTLTESQKAEIINNVPVLTDTNPTYQNVLDYLESVEEYLENAISQNDAITEIESLTALDNEEKATIIDSISALDPKANDYQISLDAIINAAIAKNDSKTNTEEVKNNYNDSLDNKVASIDKNNYPSLTDAQFATLKDKINEIVNEFKENATLTTVVEVVDSYDNVVSRIEEVITEISDLNTQYESFADTVITEQSTLNTELENIKEQFPLIDFTDEATAITNITKENYPTIEALETEVERITQTINDKTNQYLELQAEVISAKETVETSKNDALTSINNLVIPDEIKDYYIDQVISKINNFSSDVDDATSKENVKPLVDRVKEDVLVLTSAASELATKYNELLSIYEKVNSETEFENYYNETIANSTDIKNAINEEIYQDNLKTILSDALDSLTSFDVETGNLDIIKTTTNNKINALVNAANSVTSAYNEINLEAQAVIANLNNKETSEEFKVETLAEINNLVATIKDITDASQVPTKKKDISDELDGIDHAIDTFELTTMRNDANSELSSVINDAKVEVQLLPTYQANKVAYDTLLGTISTTYVKDINNTETADDITKLVNDIKQQVTQVSTHASALNEIYLEYQKVSSVLTSLSIDALPVLETAIEEIAKDTSAVEKVISDMRNDITVLLIDEITSELDKNSTESSIYNPNTLTAEGLISSIERLGGINDLLKDEYNTDKTADIESGLNIIITDILSDINTETVEKDNTYLSGLTSQETFKVITKEEIKDHLENKISNQLEDFNGKVANDNFSEAKEVQKDLKDLIVTYDQVMIKLNLWDEDNQERPYDDVTLEALKDKNDSLVSSLINALKNNKTTDADTITNNIISLNEMYNEGIDSNSYFKNVLLVDSLSAVTDVILNLEDAIRNDSNVNETSLDEYFNKNNLNIQIYTTLAEKLDDETAYNPNEYDTLIVDAVSEDVEESYQSLITNLNDNNAQYLLSDDYQVLIDQFENNVKKYDRFVDSTEKITYIENAINEMSEELLNKAAIEISAIESLTSYSDNQTIYDTVLSNFPSSLDTDLENATSIAEVKVAVATNQQVIADTLAFANFMDRIYTEYSALDTQIASVNAQEECDVILSNTIALALDSDYEQLNEVLSSMHTQIREVLTVKYIAAIDDKVNTINLSGLYHDDVLEQASSLQTDFHGIMTGTDLDYLPLANNYSSYMDALNNLPTAYEEATTTLDELLESIKTNDEYRSEEVEVIEKLIEEFKENNPILPATKVDVLLQNTNVSINELPTYAELVKEDLTNQYQQIINDDLYDVEEVERISKIIKDATTSIGVDHKTLSEIDEFINSVNTDIDEVPTASEKAIEKIKSHVALLDSSDYTKKSYDNINKLAESAIESLENATYKKAEVHDVLDNVLSNIDLVETIESQSFAKVKAEALDTLEEYKNSGYESIDNLINQYYDQLEATNPKETSKEQIVAALNEAVSEIEEAYKVQLSEEIEHIKEEIAYDDYSSAEQEHINSIIDAANDDLSNTTSSKELKEYLDKLQTEIANVETIVDEEVNSSKEDLEDLLNDALESDALDESRKEELKNYVEELKNEITGESVDEVKDVKEVVVEKFTEYLEELSSATKADAINELISEYLQTPENAEELESLIADLLDEYTGNEDIINLDEFHLHQEKIDALDTLDELAANIKPNDYSTYNQTVIDKFISDAEESILNATTLEEITQITKSVETSINNVPTIDQEETSVAKENAIKYLDKFNDGKTHIEEVISQITSDINNLPVDATVTEIEQVIADALDEIYNAKLEDIKADYADETADEIFNMITEAINDSSTESEFNQVIEQLEQILNVRDQALEEINIYDRQQLSNEAISLLDKVLASVTTSIDEASITTELNYGLNLLDKQILSDEKSSARKEVETYFETFDSDDYTEEEYATIKKHKDDALASIDNAITVADVQLIEQSAITQMDDVLTIVEKAQESLDGYVNSEVSVEVAKLIDDCKESLENLQTNDDNQYVYKDQTYPTLSEVVDAMISDAYQAIDQQLRLEEIAKAKAEINAYKNYLIALDRFSTAGIQTLEDVYADASAELDDIDLTSLTFAEDVNEIKDNAYAAMNSILAIFTTTKDEKISKDPLDIDYPRNYDFDNGLWGNVRANEEILPIETNLVVVKQDTTYLNLAKKTFEESKNDYQSPTVDLTKSEVKELLDIYLVENNKRVTVTKDGLSFTVRILIPDNYRSVRELSIAHIKDDGTLEIFDAVIEGNYIVFTTSHFSDYALVGMTYTEQVREESTEKVQEIFAGMKETTYTPEQWQSVTNIYQEALASLNEPNATATNMIDLVSKYTSDMDEHPTAVDARRDEAYQTLEEEFNSFDPNDYSIEQYKKIVDAYEKAKVDLAKATTINKVSQIEELALIQMNKPVTIAFVVWMVILGILLLLGAGCLLLFLFYFRVIVLDEDDELTYKRSFWLFKIKLESLRVQKANYQLVGIYQDAKLTQEAQDFTMPFGQVKLYTKWQITNEIVAANEMLNNDEIFTPEAEQHDVISTIETPEVEFVNVTNDSTQLTKNYETFAGYSIGFEAKLALGTDELNNYYNQVKNIILSYKGIKTRLSFKKETFYQGKETLIVLSSRGKTLNAYIALPLDYCLEKKAKAVAPKDKFSVEKGLTLIKISSDLQLRKFIALINDLMSNKQFVINDTYKEKDYTKKLRKLTRPELIAMGKIKLFRKKTLQSVNAETVNQYMSDADLDAVIITKEKDKYYGGKKTIVNLDTINVTFKEGSIIDIQALKDHKLIDKHAGYVKVLARGTLDKSLVIKAHAFSGEAMKMIILTGGEVITLVK